MPDTSSISIIFDLTNNAVFSRIAKGAANRFFAVRLTVPGRGTLLRRCVAEFAFIPTLAAGFWATPASPPDSRWRTMRTRARPRPAESIDAGGAAGSWRLVRTTTATAETGGAAILHTAVIERSDPRLAGPMLKLSSSWSKLFRRTLGRKSAYARQEKRSEIMER